MGPSQIASFLIYIKSFKGIHAMKSRTIMTFTLTVVILSFSLINLTAVPSRGFISISKVRNSTPIQSGTVIESYSFQEDREKVRFDNTTLTNSGNLTFASTILPNKGTQLSLFNNSVPTHNVLSGEYIRTVSDNGKYFFTFDTNNPSKGKFNFYNGFVKRYSLDKSFKSLAVNSIGKVLAGSRDDRRMYLYNESGTRDEIQGIPEYSDLEFGTINYQPLFSNKGLIACLASPLFEEDPDLFPKGSRLYYFDDNLTITDFVEINGKVISYRIGISNSKNYILMKSYDDHDDYNSYKIHIIHNQNEIMTLDGNLAEFSFSEDESVVILKAIFEEGSGCYIIDLSEQKIITKISGLPKTFAIANKNNPIIALQDDNIVYAYNYNTAELMLKEWIGSENLRFYGASRVQISGDGKQISAFEKQWFKKFQIVENK